MAATLSPKSEFAVRIAAAYPSLSKSHRKIADFVMTHPLEVVALSIEGVAEASGASTATITRFVRAVGYSGFSDFREKIVADYQTATGPGATSAGDAGEAGSTAALLHGFLADTVQNIGDAAANIDAGTATRFTDTLLAARRILILGTGASHYAASYLEEGLALYTQKNVTNLLLRGATPYTTGQIRTIGPEDAVIAISMPRYSGSTVEFTRIAKAQGAPILALTDSPTSPLAQLADVTFFTPAKSRLLPNSPAAIFAVADALIATIAAQRPDIVAATLQTPPEDVHP